MLVKIIRKPLVAAFYFTKPEGKSKAAEAASHFTKLEENQKPQQRLLISPKLGGEPKALIDFRLHTPFDKQKSQ